MATRDAIIVKRVEAMDRIKAALPGIEFDPLASRGGPEFQHAADLETIADELERRGGNKSTSTRKDE
jgi:hypothetical protein